MFKLKLIFNNLASSCEHGWTENPWYLQTLLTFFMSREWNMTKDAANSAINVGEQKMAQIPWR
jgi:hypothetical protein